MPSSHERGYFCRKHWFRTLPQIGRLQTACLAAIATALPPPFALHWHYLAHCVQVAAPCLRQLSRSIALGPPPHYELQLKSLFSHTIQSKAAQKMQNICPSKIHVRCLAGRRRTFSAAKVTRYGLHGNRIFVPSCRFARLSGALPRSGCTPHHEASPCPQKSS